MALSATYLLLCGLILELIPGVLCDNANVGGLVAAVVAGFFCLVAIVIMIMIATLWRDWYMRRQAARGRYRVPRKHTQKGFWRSQSQHSLTASPTSDRKWKKVKVLRTGSPRYESRNTTLSRDPQPRANAWVTQLPPVSAFEEKTKTINFEEDDEAYIVTEVLPDQTTQREQTVTVTTRTAQPDIANAPVTTAEQTTQPAVITTSASTKGSNMRTTYIPLTSEPADTSGKNIRQTTPANISYEPYHVRSTRMSQTTRPTSDQSDIIISPLIPAAGSNTDQSAPDQPAVVMFDSDDEAGNIPNTYGREDDVLF